MDYNRVISLKNSHGLTDDKMAEICGLKRGQSFADMMKRKSMKVEYLEKIAEYFKVDIISFFNANSDLPQTHILQEPTEKYESCKDCHYKDEIISLLKHRVTYFENLINEYLSSIMKATGT